MAIVKEISGIFASNKISSFVIVAQTIVEKVCSKKDLDLVDGSV